MLTKTRIAKSVPSNFLFNLHFGFWPTIARRNPCNYMLVEIHPPLIKKKSYSFLELCQQIFIGVVGRQKNILRRDFNRHYKRDRDFPCTKTSLNESAGDTIYDFKKVIFVCIRWIKFFGLVRVVKYWTHSLKKKGPVSCIFPVLGRRGR